MNKSKYLYYPRYLIVIVSFIIMIIVSGYFSTGDYGNPVFLVPTLILCTVYALIIYKLAVEKIIINKDKIIVRRMFSKNEYSFKQFTDVRIKYVSGKCWCIYSDDKKLFVFSELYVNYNLLVNRLSDCGFMM